MKPVVFILAACLMFFLSCSKTQNRLYPHYNIELSIHPLTGETEVSGTLEIPAELSPVESLYFYLDSAVEISSFRMNKHTEMYMDTSVSDIMFLPAARKILPVNNKLPLNNNIEYSFSYGGEMSKGDSWFPDLVSEDWVELGLYYPWFPYSRNIPLFTFHVKVKIDEGYTVFGIGKAEKKEGYWVIESQSPKNDLVICASKDVDTYSSRVNSNALNIYSHKLEDSVVVKMSDDLGLILTNLTNRYGDHSGDVNIILSKRKEGGGYARMGGVVLGGFTVEEYYASREAYFRYFGHELGHLWWYKASVDSWEDWLNEGFAEYTGLTVVRAVFGEEAFLARLNRKKEAIIDSPPVKGLPRDSEQAHLVLYSKAPVMIFMLEERMGREKFQRFCLRLIREEVKTTSDFLAALGAFDGENTEKWFSLLLRDF